MSKVWWMDDVRIMEVQDDAEIQDKQIPCNKVREVAYLMSDYFIEHEKALEELNKEALDNLKEAIAKIIGPKP